MQSINQTTHKWCEDHQILAEIRDIVPSTNSWAKESVDTRHPLSAFFANHQTHGRGRYERKWTNSKPGETLLSTWCLKIEQTPQPIFSIRVGLLLWESLKTTWPFVPWALKAPNDIYIKSGKLAGILIELEQRGSSHMVFIGIGANVYSQPQAIDQETTSMVQHIDADIQKKWSEFLHHFTRGLLELRKDAHRSLLTSEECDKVLIGMSAYGENFVTEVTPDGGLVLENHSRIGWDEL